MSIHLLAIGMNYPGTSSELYGCANDARDIAERFKPYCASTKVLLDSQADRDGIFKEGRKFLDRLAPGDLGILSISGHGTRERSGTRYNEAVVCADMELIYDTEMGGLLGKRARGSTLAVLADTCHAGGLPRGASHGRTRQLIPGKIVKAIPIGRCHKHKPEKGTSMRALRDVISYLAAQDKEYAYDGRFDNRPNGAMTYYLLGSVELIPTESFGKISRKVDKKLPTDEYDQTPVCVASARNLRRTLGEWRKS
jgi:metacaspase-1